MAFLDGDTFEYNNTTFPYKYSGTSVSSAVTFGSANGFFPGAKAMNTSQSWTNQQLGPFGSRFNVPGNTNLWIHFLAKSVVSGSSVNFLITKNELGNEQNKMHLNANGTISLQRGNTTVVTSTNAIIDSGWHHYALKIRVHASTGELTLKVDDVEWATFTGNTQGHTNQTTAGLTLLGAVRYWDHYTVNDDSGADNFTGWRPYPFHAQIMLPNGAGNTTQFTPSAGANYQNVDDINVDLDTTYNASSTNTQRDDYALADVAEAITGTVEGVYVRALARKTDAGSRQLSAGIYTNAVAYDGPASEPPVSVYTGGEIRNFWGKNPNTLTNFTTGEISALQASVKVRS